MKFVKKCYPYIILSLFVACSDGEFAASQKKLKKDECKEDGTGCKKELELGEPVDSLPETTGDAPKGGTTPGTLDPSSGGASVGVVISSSNPTGTSSDVCTIPPTNVGVSGKRMGPNWRCKTESMTIPDAIVLPDDATDISIEITQYGVDDWNPCTKFNGKVIGCNRNEKTQCTAGGPQPRVSKFNFDLSTHLKPGSNELYVESFNKHTFWSMWFTVSGTYRSAQIGCKHTLKMIKD